MIFQSASRWAWYSADQFAPVLLELAPALGGLARGFAAEVAELLGHLADPLGHLPQALEALALPCPQLRVIHVHDVVQRDLASQVGVDSLEQGVVGHGPIVPCRSSIGPTCAKSGDRPRYRSLGVITPA